MADSIELQAELYVLLSYLSGAGSDDFTSTTRRDMIEGCIENLLQMGALDEERHAAVIERVAKLYQGHGCADDVVQHLRAMPRVHDCALQAINAFHWTR